MEEGPEPHEPIEKTVEHHHHGGGEAHEAAGRQAMVLPAITAAVLAVFAAIGSLLSGHAANDALIAVTQSADRWAYFQSKSVKGHIYSVSREVVDALAADPARAGKASARFQEQADKYEREKKEEEERAKELQHESDHELRKHHYYAFGVVAFQVGIVLSSISMLVRYRALYYLSLLAGAAGILSLAIGFCA
jgi:hypothetical protein